MAYLAATDITVTLIPQARDFTMLGKTWTWPKVDFGDGALQYTALGIPMPAIGAFGFKKEIIRAFIEQPANGYIYSFDRANQKLRIFEGSARAAITIADHVPAVPTGNVTNPSHVHSLANQAMNPHSHGLVIATGNNIVDPIGVNGTKLVANANGATIPGGAAANGGVANTTTTLSAQGDALATTPANSTFIGVQPSNLAHVITGGGAVGAAALSEMADGVAPAATTLYMQMVGQ